MGVHAYSIVSGKQDDTKYQAQPGLDKDFQISYRENSFSLKYHKTISLLKVNILFTFEFEKYVNVQFQTHFPTLRGRFLSPYLHLCYCHLKLQISLIFIV